MYREEEVRRGIALLDEHADGWRSKFNPDTLDMSRADVCTLGQVRGSYVEGLEWLSDVSGVVEGVALVKLAAAHGFSLHGLPGSYMDLDDTWKALVPETAVDELIRVEIRELALA
jgi:hypothetical protein